MGSIPTLEVHDEEMLSQIMVKEFSSFTNRLVSDSCDENL